MSAFVDALRRLDVEATFAPWVATSFRVLGSKECANVEGPDEMFVAGSADVADARAIILLRNAAPEIAALVEAVGQALDTACDHAASMSGEAPLLLRKLVALRTALSALDAKVKP